MSMDIGSSRMQGLVNDVNGAIRENPLAAGLIGAGVAWMLFGSSRIPSLIPGAMKSTAVAAGSAASAATSAVADGISGAGSRIADAARKAKGAGSDGTQAVETAGRSAAEAAPGIYDAVAQAAGGARDRLMDTAASGREYGSAMQAKLADSLDRQPLLLGALGLAIGAGIASTFASTAFENEVMGAQGASAREKLQEFAGDTQKRAEQVVSTVKAEAQRQGLTTDAAKEAASGLAGKVKNVAGAARESVANRFADQKPA